VVARAAGSEGDDGWRTLRVDRIESVEETGHRFVLVDPPEAAELVSRATTVAPYRWTATVIVDAALDEVERLVPPTVGLLAATDDGRTKLVTGSDSLAALAAHFVALDLPCEVLDPPELRAHLLAVGRRLTSAHRVRRP
jgi:predicted DNA-binding transcriptional regulator YafY